MKTVSNPGFLIGDSPSLVEHQSCFANSFKKIVGDAGGLITDQGRHRLNKTPPPNGEQLTVRPEKRQTL